jgi:hypothetical protein
MKLHIRLAAIAAFAISSRLFAGPIVLSNNLTEPTQDIDTLSTTAWHAISFTTDNNAYTLDTVTLLMQLGGASAAAIADVGAPAAADIPEVDLYSDNSGSPGTLIAALAAIGTPSFALQNIDFAGGGNALAANSTYWIILRALSGAVSWGFASDDLGTGSGFTDVWAETGDSGATWAVHSVDQPDQAEVTADLVGAPEPSTLLMTGVGFLALACVVRRRFV